MPANLALGFDFDDLAELLVGLQAGFVVDFEYFDGVVNIESFPTN